jgi:Na+/H+ antiporter NhaD/arsenite permease-like protein
MRPIRTPRQPLGLLALLPLLLAAAPARAATEGGIDGAGLSLLWGLPFAGILLSIAILPLALPRFWHHHYGKVAAFWALAFLGPFAALHGTVPAGEALVHTALLEYIPFIILLFALFTVAGGILVIGNLHGSPGVNTGILAFGTLLASWIGTTGASMVLIRPLLRANDERRHNAHTVVFFIFLVSNIGGSLTPLGDPPLFLGFLRGVDFFWTLRHITLDTAIIAGILLLVFYGLDRWLYAREEGLPRRRDPTPDSPRLGLRGIVNLPLLVAVILIILASSAWRPGVSVIVLGTEVALQDMLRDGALIAVALLSLVLTPREHRETNLFSWEPIREVAKLFAGIFVCIIPVMAMLRAGAEGPFAGLVALVSGPDGAPRDWAYFWLTGLLSSFLDNAPTYLVFFELAGGDAQQLMGPMASTLAAISMGAVYMGANSYIGNAPNLMVQAIAVERGVRMPSFFGYIGWSVAVLIPLFVLITFVSPWLP